MNTDCPANREGCDCATHDPKHPGKFEGESRAAVHFWSLGLEGGADRDVYEHGRPVYKFRLTAEDRTTFPELKGKTWFSLVEDDNGFVYGR